MLPEKKNLFIRAYYYTLFLMVSLLLLGCAQTPSQSLYQQLGEKQGIEALAEQFLYEIAEREAIAKHFENSDLDRFLNKLTEQLCQLSSGPCTYSGDSMQDVHAGMNITHAEFNQTVEALIAAMDNLDLPTTTQNRVLALLAPMHKDIMPYQ